jgi:NhaP-type Na+/H+ or K+/H+ antiporter
MFDDPDYLIGVAAMVVVGSLLGRLLFVEWRRSWRERSIPLTSVFAGLSILCLFWFFAWMATQGTVPHGLWGLLASGVLLVPAVFIKRRT